MCVVWDPDARVRDIATDVGITERAVQRILSELEEAEVLAKERRGRRNHYTVDGVSPLRHPLEAHKSVADLIRLLGRKPKHR